MNRFHPLCAVLWAVAASVSLSAQGDVCVNFTEFCPAPDGSDLFYPAGTDSGSAEPGNNYGCLFDTPNPAWYYLQIGAPGSVTIDLTNTNNVDIDYAVWGPFPDLNVAEASCGSLGGPIDCSFSPAPVETVNIPFSQPNEIYILLITNYSNDPTNIIAEASGDGVPSCCRVPINTGETCDDPTDFECGCWTLGISGQLPLTNVIPPPADFCGTVENAQWISFDNCWCAATIEVSAGSNTANGVEAQLFQNCAPYAPLSDCISVPPGQTLALPNPNDGSDVLICEPGQEYILLLDGVAGDTSDYLVQATEVPLPPPEFAQDTILGPTTACAFDTILYQFPPIDGDVSFCTAIWSGGGEGVLSVSHDSILLIPGAPGSGGELCITASNCAGSTTFCQAIGVVACCDSEPGTLVSNAFELCADEIAQVQHTGDSLIVPDEVGLYILHDGPGGGIVGNVFDQNFTGAFGFFDDLNYYQTYRIDFVVMGLTNGLPDPTVCFEAGGNSNSVLWQPTAPALAASDPVYTCNDTESFYTVTLELANGTTYFVDGNALPGTTFISDQIPTGEPFSFAITDANDCLEPLIVSGDHTCPCLTDAGVLDDTPAQLCNTDLHIGTIITPATLDDNDVVTYELRNAAGDVLLTNASGPAFAFGPPLVYGETYFLCARAGNATGGGGPLQGYPCESTSNCQEVTFYEQISAALPAIVEITCADPEPQLVPQLAGGSGAYDYEWLHPSGATSNERLLNATEAGTYQLFVSDENNDCTISTATEVIIADVPTDLLFTTVPPTCTGDEDGFIQLDSVIGGVPPFAYRLDSLPWTETLRTYNFLPAGTYELQIRDANDCEFSAAITLFDPPEPQVSLGGDREIALGEVANLQATTNLPTFSIDWYLDGVLQTDTLLTLDSMFLLSTAVAVQIFDANECPGEDAIQVTVRRDPPLFIPNAFSPNGDGVNDKFGVFANASVREIVDFRVYDRWGSCVFERTEFPVNDVRAGWDGFFRGRPSQVGVYVYVLTVRYVDGGTETFGGDVSLLR